MEIWLDTTDAKTVKFAHELTLLHGVTTNPSLIAMTKKPLEGLLEELINEQEGPVAVQVIADEAHEIVHQAQKLYRFSSRLIIKVPVTFAGYQAMKILNEEAIPVMATAIFEPYQAYLAFKFEAKYLAFYFGRIADQKKDLNMVMQTILTIRKNYGFEGKILAAGIRNLEHVTLAAETGCDAITLPQNMFHQFLETQPATQKAVLEFQKDWSLAKENALLPTSL